MKYNSPTTLRRTLTSPARAERRPILFRVFRPGPVEDSPLRTELTPDMLIQAKSDGESARSWVYRCLLDNIVELRLLPGQALVETDLSDFLGVSRTPLRDALFRLSREQFVTIIPQSRTLVSKINLLLVEESRYIRRCVEMDIVRKAAGRIDEEQLLALRYSLGRQDLANKKHNSELVFRLDEELHRTLFDIAGMPGIWESLNKQHLHLRRMRNLYHTRNKNTDHVVAQHKRLLAALEKGDSALAESVMDRHLSADGWDMRSMLEEFPDYVE